MCPDRGAYFDLFGWSDGDLDHVRDTVEEALGFDLKPHEAATGVSTTAPACPGARTLSFGEIATRKMSSLSRNTRRFTPCSSSTKLTDPATSQRPLPR